MAFRCMACDPPIRRASSQAYNCRTRRKDRVRFDPRTLGHNHGTGHGWCSSYSLCRSYNCQVFVRRYDSRTPKKILFVVPAMSRWSSSVVRVVAILHTNKNQASHTHTHILTSICRVKAPRPGTIGRGAGRMRRLCSQFRLYLRQEVTRTQILVVEEEESNGNVETVAVARKSPSSKMLHIHSRPHQQCVPYLDTSIIVIIIIIIIIIIHSSSSSSSSRKKE